MPESVVVNFEAIAQAFQSAAIDPTLWNVAMDVASRETHSYGAIMVPMSGKISRFPVSHSLTETVSTYVNDGWIHRDERYRAAPKVRRYGFATERDIFSEEELKRSAFHQEFLARFQLKWWGALKIGDNSDPWVLSIQRSVQQEEFSNEEQRNLLYLSCSLEAPVLMAHALGFARAAAALEAFEISGTPAVMLDRSGKVFCINPSFEALLDGCIQIVRGRVTSINKDATEELERALNAILWNATRSSLARPVVLPRVDRKPVIAYPLGLEGASRDALAPGRAIVLFRDLESTLVPTEASVSAAFGLTPAEARLTIRLARGMSLEDAAGSLNIRKQTARNHLKSIFEKTGESRQAAVVALVLRLLGEQSI